MKDSLFAIWLSLRAGVGNCGYVKLLNTLGSPYAVFNAGEYELKEAGATGRMLEKLCDKDLSGAYDILTYCEQHGVGITAYGDEIYPASLRSLKDPPCVLYYLGKLPDLNRRLCISVVGKRDMSEYGMNAAYKISYELAGAGTVIVSGMALGIDGVASGAAIAANGETVAVLGCGIDVVYPKQHSTLMRNIISHGAVITEFPPSTPPIGANFPVRNRIISGLSQGTLVVEADLSSGAMITAKNAILQGRDIYAIPGNIGEVNSTGTNQLIRDGAAVVLSGRDILENYAFMYRDTIDMSRLSVAERNSVTDTERLSYIGVASRTEVIKKAGKNNDIPIPEPYRSDIPKKPEPQVAASFPDMKYPEKSENKPKTEGDRSAEILAGLSETQRKIFSELPMDHAVAVDALSKLGYKTGEIMAALTVLEIKGLVQSLPGGLYSRK